MVDRNIFSVFGLEPSCQNYIIIGSIEVVERTFTRFEQIWGQAKYNSLIKIWPG